MRHGRQEISLCLDANALEVGAEIGIVCQETHLLP